MEDNHIKFDFLGKDSIRYENEVQVNQRVYELVQEFCRKDGQGKRESPVPSTINVSVLWSQMLQLSCMISACSSLVLRRAHNAANARRTSFYSHRLSICVVWLMHAASLHAQSRHACCQRL